MLTSIWRIRRFIRPYRPRLLIGIVAFGLARFFEALIPFFTASAINRLWEGNFNVKAPVIGILAAVLVRYIVVTFARYNVRRAGLFVAFDLRRDLYQALQKQGEHFFSTYTIGDMMTRAIADISLVQRLVSMGTILLVIVIYATVFGFGFMLYLSPTLTLLLLPPLPFIFWYTLRAAKQMEDASQEVQDQLSDLGTQVQENLSGIRTIQSMALEDWELERFSSTNQKYASAFFRQSRVNSLMAAWMPSLAAFCSLIILGYGGSQVMSNELQVGSFVAFFMYVNMVTKPFSVAGFIINLFQRAGVASARLLEIIDRNPEIKDTPHPSAPTQIAGKITISDLSYRYPNAQQYALRNISLTINPGETVAIMGRIGSGKTTLLKQLIRLIDPLPGTVQIDDCDVTSFPLSQLRSQVVYVPQSPFLFGESLKNNISYDKPARSVEKIWEAVESSDLCGTVKDFPEQLDTLVGERGVTLSGGQKQRTTLARGVIRTSNILMLDDCFSAVDTETEENILEALSDVKGSQTVLLVSHRVSTAKRADRIILMDDGKILEVGTHEELLKTGGYYSKLERVQREGGGDNDFEGIGLLA